MKRESIGTSRKEQRHGFKNLQKTLQCMSVAMLALAMLCGCGARDATTDTDAVSTADASGNGGAAETQAPEMAPAQEPASHLLDCTTGYDSQGRLNRAEYYQNSDLFVYGADPDVIYVSEEDDPVYGGYFYLYVSSESDKPNGTFDVLANWCFRSKDMVSWELCGVFDGYSLLSDPDDWTLRNFWAPEVYRHPEDGKYYMYCSAQRAVTDRYTDPWDSDYDRLYLVVAVSDAPMGPFKIIRSGTDANGNEIKNEPIFNFAEHYGLDTVWSCIDANLFRDTDGSLYLTFNKHADTSGYPNGVWGIKLLDPVTPDWSTITCLTINGEKSVLDYPTGTITMPMGGGSFIQEGLNEGGYLYRHNDRYYLTYSPLGYANPAYDVWVAVSDKPLGPYVKPDKGKGNPLVAADTDDMPYMAGTGHHCFLTIGDELFSVYAHHGNPNNWESGVARVIGMDRVEVTEIDGEEMLVCNGPTKTPQCLAEAVSGYENVAGQARVTVSGGEGAEYLNDGLLSVSSSIKDREYVSDGPATITLEFPEPVKASSLLVYNSSDYAHAFSSIDEIRFYYDQPITIDGKDCGTGVIKNLAFPENNVNTKEKWIYKGAAAIADFDEISVSRIEMDISKTYASGDDASPSLFGVSEIMVLRKNPGQGLIEQGPVPDTDSYMVVDGVLDEDVWAGKKTFTDRFSGDTDQSGVGLSLTTHMTEKGLYVGAVVEDSNIVDDGYAAAPRLNSTLELNIAIDGLNTAPCRVYLDAHQVVSPSNPDLAFCAYGARVDGEVGSGETKGMTMELFLPWSSLRMDVPEDPDSVTVRIYPIYSAMGQKSMPPRFLRLIPTGTGTKENYIRFTSQGFADADPDGALLGDSAYGTAKAGAWDVSDVVSDVSRSDENTVALSGTAKNTGGKTAYAYLTQGIAGDFVWEATISPTSIADMDSYGACGLGVLLPNEKVVSFCLRYTADGKELDENASGKQNLRRLVLFRTYGDYENSTSESEQLADTANSGFDRGEGVHLKMVKLGTQFSVFADDKLLWSDVIKRTNSAGAPVLIAYNSEVQFSDICFTNYDGRTEELNERLTDWGVAPAAN